MIDLAMHCPLCGVPAIPSARFCHRCGGALGPGAPPRARAITVLLWIGTAILVLLSIGYALEIGRTLSAYFQPSGLGVPITKLHQPLKSSNGVHLCSAVFFGGLALLALNRARPGIVDRVLARRGGVLTAIGAPTLALAIAFLVVEDRGVVAYVAVGLITAVSVFIAQRFKTGPATLPAILAFAGLAWIEIVETVRHRDPTSMAEAIESRHLRYSLSNAGDVLFAREATGRVHRAAITPELVREFRRRDLSAGLLVQNEFVAPGWMPLALLGFAIVAERLASRRGLLALPALATAFGVAAFFVSAWIGTAQQGLFAKGHWLHPQATPDYFIALIVSGVFLRRGYLAWKNADAAAKPGRAALYFFLASALPLGVLLVTERSVGTPMVAWTLAWLGLGSIAWMRSTEAPA